MRLAAKRCLASTCWRYIIPTETTSEGKPAKLFKCKCGFSWREPNADQNQITFLETLDRLQGTKRTHEK